MKTFATLLVAAGILGACATQGTVAQAQGNVYRGEVWTWDPTLSVVTLLQGDQKVRVKVTPDQLLGLHERDIVTVRGELAPPMEIDRFMVQGPPMRAVPTGPMDQSVLTGTITAVDPSGKISIATSRGPLDVWVATPVGDRFRSGASVQMKATLQAVSMVPAGASQTSEAAALVAQDPGDNAVVTGRILALDATGRVTIESPRGPVTVWVADTSRYQVGQVVQLRTSVLVGA